MTATCPQCETPIPHDRDACPKCGASRSAGTHPAVRQANQPKRGGVAKFAVAAIGLSLLAAIFFGSHAVVALPALLVYFIPSMIASRRRHANETAITALNLFLGWTFLGWVAALVWAFTNDGAGRPAQ